MPPSSVSPYAHPLYYDIIHTPGTADEVAAFARIARRFLRRHARDIVWVEPACGSGRALRVLARRGCPVVGLDLDRGMVAFARAELARKELGAHARVLTADMRAMNAQSVRRAIRSLDPAGGRPIVAFCPHNSVRHLSSDRDMLAHLRSTSRLIGPSGLYLLGIGLSGKGGEPACETVAHARRAGITCREAIDFVPPDFSDPARPPRGRGARTEHAYRHLSVSTPAGEREFISRYRLRTYTLEQWRSIVRRAGLTEIAVTDAWARPLAPTRLHYAIRVLRPSAIIT